MFAQLLGELLVQAMRPALPLWKVQSPCTGCGVPCQPAGKMSDSMVKSFSRSLPA